MKKIVLIFGIIAGLICGGMFFIMRPENGQFDFDNGQLYGYITMIIAFGSIFFAVRQYRDKFMEGRIKFGKAFLIGLYITLIAGVVYVLAWEVFMSNYGADFVDQYAEYQQVQMQNKGMDAAEIDEALAAQKEMMEMYKSNRLMRMGMSFLEILPVGLIMSLLSALLFAVILKKKE